MIMKVMKSLPSSNRTSMIFFAFFISFETGGVSGGGAGDGARASSLLTLLVVSSPEFVGGIKKRRPGSTLGPSVWEFGELNRTARVKGKLLSSGRGIEGSVSFFSGIFSIFDNFAGTTKSGEAC